MKKIFFLAAAFIFTLGALAQPKPEDVVKVNTEKHDFGKIKVGVPVTYSFELKNISDHPLVVENSYSSCGCTTPQKIVDPIMPGETALLKVAYSAAAPVPFTKEVFIKFAGVETNKIVVITGEVLSEEAYAVYLKTKKDN